MDNIYLDQNVFIDKNSTDTNFESLNFNKKQINANKLCIYTDSDIECITAAELKSALELPNFRKYEVCINDACIDIESAKILNGSKPITLKSRNNDDGFKDKCIGITDLDAHQCKPPPPPPPIRQSRFRRFAGRMKRIIVPISTIVPVLENKLQFKVQSLIPVDCNDPSAIFSFKEGKDLSNINSLNTYNMSDDTPNNSSKSIHTSDIDEFVRPLQ